MPSRQRRGGQGGRASLRGQGAAPLVGSRGRAPCWGPALRSSTKELITPFENPKVYFAQKKRLFETPGLVESSSPELDLFSYIKEHSEEETTEIMTETMEQYMSKTRENYRRLSCSIMGSMFPPDRSLALKARSTETSDRLTAIQAQLNNLRREIKKVDEKVYAAQVGCELCKGPYYTKDCPLKEEGNTLEEAYYTQFGAQHPFTARAFIEQQGQDSTNATTEILRTLIEDRHWKNH
ncbi:hypothetical protein Tco_0512221 [Tanacetum coccineum]